MRRFGLHLIVALFAAFVALAGAGGWYVWSTLKSVETALPLTTLEQHRGLSGLIDSLSRVTTTLDAARFEPTAGRLDEFTLSLDLAYATARAFREAYPGDIPDELQAASAEVEWILSTLDQLLADAPPVDEGEALRISTRLSHTITSLRNNYLQANQRAMITLSQQVAQIKRLRLSTMAVLALIALSLAAMSVLMLWQRRTITKMADMDLALRASEQRFRDFAEATADWFWETGPDGRFTFISDRFYEEFKVKPTSILGKTRKEFISDVELETEPDKWRKHFDDLEAHRPFRDLEYNIAGTDGKKRYLSVNGVPIFDAAGNFQGYRGADTDITERKRAEQELEQKEAQLRIALDNMPGGMRLVDKDRNNVLFNSQYLELYDFPDGLLKVGESNRVENLYQAQRGDFGPGDPQALTDEWLAALPVQTEPMSWEDTPVGGKILQVNTSPTPDGGVVNIVSDITERKRAEEALREQTKTVELLHKTASDANEAQDVEEALRGCLDAVCAYTGWPVGHVYLCSPDDPDKLLPAKIWHFDDPKRFAAFKKVTEKTTFERGVGLPGRVLASGKPAWIVDVTKDPNFPRAKQAKNIGVKAGFAVPVLAEKNVVAVLEFFSPEAVEPDEALLKLLDNAGGQVGRVLERKQAEEELKKARDKLERRVEERTAELSKTNVRLEQEIAEHERAEDALRESEARLKAIIDNSPVELNLKDTDGRYIFVNPQFEKLYGVPPEEAVGKTAYDFFPKETADRVYALDQEVIEKRAVIEQEKDLPLADGVRTVLTIKFPVFDSAGQVVAVGETSTDITGRKRAEQTLRESEQRFKDFAETASDWLWEMGPDLRFTYFSGRFKEILRVDPESYIGKKRREVADPHEDPEKWEKHLDDLKNHRPFRNFEYKIRRPDGTSVDIEISGSPIISEGSEFCGYRGVGRDISERKRRQVQLIQTSKMATLGEMATGVAHELNQPLNVIRMAADNTIERIEEGDFDAGYLLGKLTRISAQTERAATIIDHMRIFGRTSDEKPGPIDPREVILNALGLMGEQLRLWEIEVETVLPEHCRNVSGHAVQLEQVLLNLIGNARDAIEANSTSPGSPRKIGLMVEQTGPEDTVKLIVEDSGGGIPDKIIKRVFEPFFTTKEAGKGTGLGLSISYGIVSDMGGVIEAANAGDGARITITLPVAAEPTSAA